MKIAAKLKNHILCISSIMLISSCENPEITSENLDLENVTQSNENNSYNTLSRNTSIVFHKHFHKNLGSDEIDEQWNKMVQSYFNTMEVYEKSDSKTLYYLIATETGTGEYDGTDDEVRSSVKFYINKEDFIYSNTKLDIPNFNDREGGSDLYLVRYDSTININTAELRSVKITLIGTDGWKLNKVAVQAYSIYQISPSDGYTHLSRSPYLTLDNNCSSCSSDYFTGNDTSTGELIFQ